MTTSFFFFLIPRRNKKCNVFCGNSYIFYNKVLYFLIIANNL